MQTRTYDILPDKPHYGQSNNLNQVFQWHSVPFQTSALILSRYLGLAKHPSSSTLMVYNEVKCYAAQPISSFSTYAGNMHKQNAEIVGKLYTEYFLYTAQPKILHCSKSFYNKGEREY